ncbi:CHAD domain-containing protein [Thiothrix caldifontis]|uniref:CHAD domain-containing protein n=2 Tax=Thiothrix caldifontis TaxID=525918 RepID=A0A1H4DAY1_9GAMM|nr:CHAD domain-containing protein [Thiothrix caldifontis]
MSDTHDTNMDAFTINALQERIDNYLQLAAQVRVDDSPDTIHDFRIASRSVLAVEPLLRATSKTRKWRKPMSRWLKALNQLRDLQVMQERLGKNPELNRELEAGIQAELWAWGVLRPKIADKAFRKRLAASLEHFFQHCEDHPGYFTVTALALWWKTLGKVQARLAAVKQDEPATLHRLRIAVKNLRYLVNTLRHIGAIPTDANAGLKHWHDLLGDIQDRQVAESWLDSNRADRRLSIQQLAESAALCTQFNEEQYQFQSILIRLDATVTACLIAIDHQ